MQKQINMENNLNKNQFSKHFRTIKQRVLFFFANFVFLLLTMAFILWWQSDLSLIAYADGIWFVFALQLTLSWSIFVYNMNIFTPLVHGVKTFFLIFVGRKPKEDFFTYYSKIKDNPIPFSYIWIAFFLTLVSLLVAILLTLWAY
jgi:hypothetical protein